MKKIKLGLLLFMVLIIGAGSFIISGIFSSEETIPRMAPLNEEFLQLQKDPSLAILSRYSDDGYPLGLLPSPHDVSYFKYLPEVKIAGLPSSYDLRNKNKLTTVKNQGSCGSCWAFATYGSLESFLMPNEKRDFSEQNLIKKAGLDYSPCEGGNIDMSTAYLARWSGPINEDNDPYIYNSADAFPVKKHVQEVIFIPSRSGNLTNSLIKNAVMTSGAVYTSMYWKSACYNSSNKAYYNKSFKEGGHAVAIVGWDDNFSKNKFNSPPPGNGAFIVRNSWGKSWGENGYFYASYYDKYFGRRGFNAVVTAEGPKNYTDIYQYDPLGWVTSLGFGSNTAWFSNIFTSTSNTALPAVSFYTAASQNFYEIYIYKDVSGNKPRSGTRVAKKTGQIDSPGYFTIELDKPVALLRNQRFSVVVKLKTTGYSYPIPVEYPLSNYSSSARASSGESFISSNGSTWYDIHTSWGGVWANTNVCLKAFAGYPPPELTIIAGLGGTTAPSPGTHTYDQGTTVTVRAILNKYYIFNHWSGDLSGSANPETITMNSDKSIKANFRLIYPPLNVSGQKTLNRSLLQGEYINVLKWEANSNNQGINIAKYRIYQIDGNQRNLLVELDAGTFEYWHRNVEETESYLYEIAAVTAWGREGQPINLTIQ